MKPLLPSIFPSSTPFLRSLLALGAGALFAPSSGAAVLLIVDVGNPAAVTVTATDGKPSDSESATWTFDGIVLLSFFIGDIGTPGGQLDAASTLKPSGSRETYNVWDGDNFSTSGGQAFDLNLHFNNLVDDPQNFDTAQPAFTGTAVLDLSALSALLPAAGIGGSILSGYSDLVTGPVIGEYTVVPEVSAGAQAGLFGLGAAGLLLLRRRQQLPA